MDVSPVYIDVSSATRYIVHYSTAAVSRCVVLSFAVSHINMIESEGQLTRGLLCLHFLGDNLRDQGVVCVYFYGSTH